MIRDLEIHRDGYTVALNHFGSESELWVCTKRGQGNEHAFAYIDHHEARQLIEWLTHFLEWEGPDA